MQWPDHEALLSIADNARRSMDMDLALTGITIRVSKGLSDEVDREKIWFIFINDNVSIAIFYPQFFSENFVNY